MGSWFETLGLFSFGGLSPSALEWRQDDFSERPAFACRCADIVLPAEEELLAHSKPRSAQPYEPQRQCNIQQLHTFLCGVRFSVQAQVRNEFAEKHVCAI